jgi:hypothetical protein
MSDERNRAKEGHPPHTLPNLPVQTGGVHVSGCDWRGGALGGRAPGVGGVGGGYRGPRRGIGLSEPSRVIG